MKKRSLRFVYPVVILLLLFAAILFLAYDLKNIPLESPPIKEKSQTSNEVILEGQLDVIVVDDFENKHSWNEYYLNLDGKDIRKLDITNTPEYKNIEPGTKIRVSGTTDKTKKELRAKSITKVEQELSYGKNQLTEENVYFSPIDDSSVLGEKKIVAVLVNFADDQSQPISIQQAQDRLFNSNRSLASYMSEVSYGKMNLTGQVYGWFTSSLTQSEASEYPFPTIKEVITYVDYVMIIYGPHLNTSWAGSADLGKRKVQTWDGESYLGVTLINDNLNYFSNGNTLGGIPIHELGHNIGLYHANNLECGDVSIANNCISDVYGDMFDIMGSHQPGVWGQFNGFHKSKIGWLNSENIIEVNGIVNQDFTIYPIELPGSQLKMLKIDTPYFNYSVEYRKPIGFDKGFDKFYNAQNVMSFVEEVYDGALVHIDLFNLGDTQLIDMSPHHGTDLFDMRLDNQVAVLRPGQIFSDSSRGLSITTLEAADNYLKVHIKYELPCIDSDNGINYTIKGNLTYNPLPNGSYQYTVWDSCSGNKNVFERYCDANGAPKDTTYTCPINCLNGACTNQPKCIDSDNGINYNVKGILQYNLLSNGAYQYSVTDSCSGNKNVFERYCDANGAPKDITYTCPINCLNGACTNQPKCIDSDGGLSYNVKGKLNYNLLSNGSYQYTVWDGCTGVSSVFERYCDANGATQSTTYTCPYGCSNGACKQQQVLGCSDSDGGLDYFTQGTIQYGQIINGNYQYSANDICLGNTLIESTCNGINPQSNYYECSNGCSNGACSPIDSTGLAVITDCLSGKSIAEVSWNGNLPLGLWIMINQGFTPNGNDYYAKAFPTTNNAVIPTGFVSRSQITVNNGALQPVPELVLQQGNQYAIWIWDGSKNSRAATFAAATCSQVCGGDHQPCCGTDSDSINVRCPRVSISSSSYCEASTNLCRPGPVN